MSVLMQDCVKIWSDLWEKPVPLALKLMLAREMGSYEINDEGFRCISFMGPFDESHPAVLLAKNVNMLLDDEHFPLFGSGNINDSYGCLCMHIPPHKTCNRISYIYNGYKDKAYLVTFTPDWKICDLQAFEGKEREAILEEIVPISTRGDD